MSAKAIAGAAALAAVGVVAIVIGGDELPPQAGDVRKRPERVFPFPDGGWGYAAEYTTADGGEAVRIVAANCVRRAEGVGVGGCRWNHPTRGLIDQGALNRFPAAQSTGGQCQIVACGIDGELLVDGGDPAAEEESVALLRKRGQ